ncbi:unnamed protein product [Malus baccata var. baccata]
MANEAHCLSTSLSLLPLLQHGKLSPTLFAAFPIYCLAVLPSKGLSFLVNSRFNRSRQTRTSMEMQGNGVVWIPHVLTVAGSDSGAGAGAGIQADLKACAARGVYCSAVITAVTAQNTVGVQVKTGMFFGIIKILHQQLQEYPIRALVVDPVMVSTSGEVLAGPSILPGFSMSLLYSGVPLNLYSGICTKWSWSWSFLFGHFFLVANVLVKGGDLPDSLDAIDVFFDGEHLYELRSSCIKTRNTHGTGCTLASCIAAELAKESDADFSLRICSFPFVHLDNTLTLLSAKSCLQIFRAYGVPLLINDRIDVALASDADGVHIGQSDMPAHVARSLLGPRKIIGVSCKTPEQAWLGGADYIGCGGVQPTNTKENNLTVGLDGLKTVCLASKLPVVAIGGINVSNARPVMEMGVPNLKGVAVVSALFDRECVLTETRKLHAVLTEAAAAVN